MKLFDNFFNKTPLEVLWITICSISGMYLYEYLIKKGIDKNTIIIVGLILLLMLYVIPVIIFGLEQ